jgi:nicotinamide-nucleotide adenylyltransferase
MNSEKEILACINKENIKFLQSGQISKFIFPMERSKAHKDKIPHLIIRFFILAINSNNQILYLVQKRSKKKKSFPNYFTDSASGHVIYKKNLNLKDIKLEALRELEEEFGITAKFVKKIVFYDLSIEEDKYSVEIAYMFFGLVDKNVELHPNPDELDIDGSKFYSHKNLQSILENQQSVDHSKKIWSKLLSEDITSIFGEQKTLKKKRNDIALFIGRFQPLHHGHIYVIKKILKTHNLLKIGIGSSQLSNTLNDPFTSEERKQFLISALKKREIPLESYKIFEIPDIFDAQKWPAHVESIVGEFNTVYSNSDWVRQLFQRRGINVGEKMVIFKNKFNGSHIRKLMLKNNKGWVTLIPKEVVNLIKKFKGVERIKSLK